MENVYDTDPPILREVKVNADNIDYLASKKIIEHDLGSFLKHMPSHTQPVERCVKLVTEASKMICGEKARDGLIANTLTSRNIIVVHKEMYTFKYVKIFSLKPKSFFELNSIELN